ncbi:MAG: hypothetical protein PHY57_00240 [Ignavibacterium sp.]|jgi:hypothetical protein|nr:hypothetical protein [Ignavibacterium sp.]MDD5606917.1 hypothetical protein [Ignavibacterium sp.]MDX9712797.1 hypothetical protein [Ignavibacteriaceae bacterium]
MRLSPKQLIIFVIFLAFQINAQVETVPLKNGVYLFLKEMKVKGILDYIREDDPVLSRFEVKNLLNEISKHKIDLSNTELKLLDKYLFEFSESIDPDTTTQLFNPQQSSSSDLEKNYFDKIKYLYAYKGSDANFYLDLLGDFYHGQDFSQTSAVNSNLFDIGFRLRGTIFNHLGYSLTAIKGGGSGNRAFAEIIEPKLLSNYKWVESIENIDNYDFTFGYLKYYSEPAENMHLSVQLGREDITLGYGYGSKLLLSGDNPAMDFIKFNFDYGIVSISSLHASTTGYFHPDRSKDHTKFFAFNHLKLKFDNLFDIGIGESIIYSGRGLDISYLTPVGFYKFIEMSIQDRDNGSIYFDLQTKFLKNLELQGTFFLDEDILSNLAELDKYTNKTAYQLGAFWYQPIGINDLSLILEYTRIRPYVYTHYDIKNNYTAFGANLGHRIGPNSDEIMIQSNYNFNEWIRLSAEYRYQREGENIYDDNGGLIKNVGGDIAVSHGYILESEKAYFLDGERVNTNFLKLAIKIEPIRGFFFDLSYNYLKRENLAKHLSSNQNFALLKFTFEY